MKILFLSQRVPYPPNKGDKLRSFNEIRYLSRNHSISLVCLADVEGDQQYRDQLLAYCTSVDIVFNHPFRSRSNTFLSLFSSRPLTLGHFYSGELQTILSRKLQEERFDLIFVYCSSMAQFVELVTDIPRVIDYVDVDSEKWHQYARYTRFPMSLVYRIESQRMREYERWIASNFQHGFLVSEKEASDFRQLVTPNARVTGIANGVDLEAFHPATAPYEPHTIVFPGAMDYYANVDAVTWFVEDILPQIRRQIPDVMFYIVGNRPTDAVRKLAERHPNIVVTGFVDRVQPYLHRAAVCVAPMRIARGVQNKILEAMAAGVPVVTTFLGFEGVAAESYRAIAVADDPEQFSEQVVMIMQDRRMRDDLSHQGRVVTEAHYRWETNLARLEDILVAVAGIRGVDS